MEQEERLKHTGPIKTVPLIVLPPYVPASPEEIARRKALAKEVDRLREAIGPVAVDLAEWIREDRERNE